MEQIFLTEDVAVCGVVKAELMHGARNKEDIDRIMKALETHKERIVNFPCKVYTVNL